MSFLEEVLASRRRDVQRSRRLVSLAELQAALEARSPNAPRRDFAAALRTGSPAIIAEIKRSSPSAGEIAQVDAAQLARAYERGGAAALSVVTEPRWFGGSLDDIAAAKRACRLPVLRKDFVVDEYQVWESAAAGADAVLLIVAALGAAHLEELKRLAELLDMAALIEVHDETEAEAALRAGASIIGINNRDLRSLAVDMTTALRVRRALPDDRLVVAESGYAAPTELTACAAARIDAVLVGESLVRASDPEAALRALQAVRA